MKPQGRIFRIIADGVGSQRSRDQLGPRVRLVTSQALLRVLFKLAHTVLSKHMAEDAEHSHTMH